MVKVPPDTNLDRVTWITNDVHKWSPNRFIICPNCKGIIYFCAEELLDCRARGANTSTPCRPYGKAEDWHPGWPPEPWLEYDGTGFDRTP